jgi:hypothetical protein
MNRTLLALLAAAIATCGGGVFAAQDAAPGAAVDKGKGVVSGAGGAKDERFRDRSGEPLETLTGEVTLLRRAGGSEGNPSGAPVITVRIADGSALIFHVGPPFFRDANDFPIAVGDVLEATGWRDRSAGYDSLLVRTVKNGDKTLEVRDATGERLWKRPDPADDGAPFESITGEVIGFGMKAFEPAGSVADSGDNGVVLMRTAEGELFGHIGPASFRQSKGLDLALGDQITLRAWRIDARMANRPFVIVRSVVDGDVDLELRTDRRKPHWK